MTTLDDCCATCPGCGTTVCIEGWPANTCLHGQAICDQCAPGDCPDCQRTLAEEALAPPGWKQARDSGNYEAPCPTCQNPTNEVLLCSHTEQICLGCCMTKHRQRCPDCHGAGAITYGRDSQGYPLTATCASCEGERFINQDKT